MRKAELADLLERVNTNTFVSKEVELKGLGMTVTVVKQPLRSLIAMVSSMEQGDAEEQFAQTLMLIYQCVPLFRDEKLIKAANVGEPYEVVSAVLQDDLGDITALINTILSFYNLDKLDELVKK